MPAALGYRTLVHVPKSLEVNPPSLLRIVTVTPLAAKVTKSLAAPRWRPGSHR
jgi:hypothetical protein